MKNIWLYFFTLSICLITNTATVIGQGATCNAAEPFCTNAGVTFPAGVSEPNAPVGNNYGCLSEQPNPAWYYLQIDQPGNIDISLTNSNAEDIDFILYGPFPNLTTANAQCGNLGNGGASGDVVDCSYAIAVSEEANIVNGRTGDVYILLITNYSNHATDINATQISGAGSTDCSILLPCAPIEYNNIITGSPYDCTDPVVNLTAVPSTSSPDNLSITPGFLFDINTDAFSSIQNTLELYAGSNATGPILAYWGPTNTGGNYQGQLPNNSNFQATIEYLDPTISYSLRWCDSGNSGTFSNEIRMSGTNTVISNTPLNGSAGCTIINLGSPEGVASFSSSGPGIINNSDGTGSWNPAIAGPGVHTITYNWNNRDVCVGSMDQTVVVCCDSNYNIIDPIPDTICVGDAAYFEVTAPGGGSTQTLFSNNTAANISSGGTASSSINVTGINPPILSANTIDSVCVTINNNPTSNLNLFLISPSGNTIDLSSGNGGISTTSYSNVCFSPSATDPVTDYNGAFAVIPADTALLPEVSFTNLSGGATNGEWQLRVDHTSSINPGGTIVNWSIHFAPTAASNSYTWSGPNLSCTDCPNPSASPTVTSDYSVTVVDPLGCSYADTVTINVQSPLEMPVVSCGTISNSSITFDWTAVASATGYEVSLDNGLTWTAANGTLSHTVSGLAPATSVLISVRAIGGTGFCPNPIDTQSCTTDPCPLIPNLDAQTNVSCNGGNDGTATISVANGVGTISYQEIAPRTGAAQADGNFTGLSAGVYTFEITDASPGFTCSVVQSVTITEPSALTTTSSVSNDISCNGGNDGEIETTPTGGTTTTPYTYLWDDGNAQSTATATNLIAGTYTVTVTDHNNCTITDIVTITEPSAITLTQSNTSVSCFNGDDGTATVVANGGTAAVDYNYLWNDPNAQTNATATGLAAGTYTVTVTDDNGCSDIITTTIDQPADPLSATVAVTSNYQGEEISCNGACDGTAEITTNGGTAPYSFNWSNSQTGTTATGLCAGTHNVTVTDDNGCSLTTTVTLTEPTALTATITSTRAVSCNGGTDGTATVTPAGGTGAYTYNWPDGQTTQEATGLAAGNYEVTVTDENNCSIIASATITQPSLVAINASVTSDFAGENISCNGANDGVITATASGGVGGFNYLWDNGQTTNEIINLAAGTYCATVTDANGCPASTCVTITEPSAITLTQSNTSVSCFNGDDGTATVVANGGTAAVDYNYLWNDPNAQTNTTATGLAAGTYTVTVTDDNGCSDIITTTIDQPADPLSATVAVTSNYQGEEISCNGACDGTAEITTNGGTAPYSFNWSNSQTGTTATGLCAGTHNVTVTDDNGCSLTTTVTLTEPTALTATITSTRAVSCNGGTDGTATVTPAGGTGAYTYNWPDGQTTQEATGLAAGNYEVTVTDENNCSITASATITQPSLVAINASVTSDFAGENISCNGANDGVITATASGGVGGFNYLWDNGQTTNEIINLVAGTYCATVTDANGCPASTCVTITEPSAITLTQSNTSVSCFNGDDGTATVVANGGTAAVDYNYLWNDPNAQTNATATGLAAGTYTVTVTDDNGCSDIITTTIDQPADPITTTMSSTPAECFNQASGTATTTPSGGTAPYSYVWEDGQTTQTAVNIFPGIFRVTITDANSCSMIDSVVVGNGIVISQSITATDVLCFGGTDGTASYTATGGNGGFTYMWDDGQTTTTATSLAAGLHCVTATDINGCTIDTCIQVNEPTAIGNSTFIIDRPISCSYTSDGSVTLGVTGGTPPYDYAWSNGQTTATASNLDTAMQYVTVTDANLCTYVDSIQLIAPAELALTMDIDSVNCRSGADGSIEAIVTGGTPAYSYNWSNGGTTTINNNLSAGFYDLTVTDNNGCTITTTEEVGEPASIVIANILSTTDVSCFGSTDGSIDADASGGTPNYTFMWSNGVPTEDLTNLATGTYTVTATDANGCTASATTTIGEPSQIVTNISVFSNYNGAAISCPGAADGALQIAASGGQAPYTYAWSGATAQNTSIATNLAEGLYRVTVTDASGCIVIDSMQLNDPIPLEATATHVDVFCNDDCDGQIIVTATSGTGTVGMLNYEYNINGPNQIGNVFSATNNFQGLCAGTYTITVRDGNDCTLPVSVTIEQPDVLTVSNSTTPVSCNGGANGTATAIPSGGTAPYSYAWSNGATTATATDLSATGYEVTVTDANGCDVVSAVVIEEPTILTTTTSFDTPSCNGSSDGSATVAPSGGTAPYSYAWSNGATTATALGLNAGTYSLTTTDANACQIVNDITITQPQLLTVSITETNLSCAGNGSGTAIAIPVGGTAPYSYLWSDGQTTDTASGLNAATYNVVVVDSEGCSANAQTTLAQPTPVVATLLSTTPTSCQGNLDGAARIMATGGTAPYSYLWSDGQTTDTVSGLAAGNQTATITDANGCFTTIDIFIREPAILEITEITSTNVNCKNGADGTATALVNGGTFPYSFNWSHGATTQNISGLAAGNYQLTVSDGNGCSTTSAVLITEPATSLVGVLNISDALCNGDASGQLTAVISGGIVPPSGEYNYLWSNGETTAIIDNLAAGTYTVTVTDHNGCSIDLSATIGQAGSITTTVNNSTEASCFQGNDGTATIIANGGTGGLTYQWSDPAAQATPTASNLTAGVYYVTITDANGCSLIDSVNVGQADPFTANVTVSDVLCFGQSTGQIELTSSSTTPAVILWSNGQVGNLANNLAAGAYTMTITNIDNCVQEFNYLVEQPDQLALTINEVSSILCNDDTTAALSASVSGGTPAYRYAWSNGTTRMNLNNIPAGNYSLVVTDANACTISQSIELANPLPLDAVPNINAVSCVGDNNGSIQLDGFGGSTTLGNYEYSLDSLNWQMGNLFPNLNSGQYAYYVKDNNGCIYTDSVEVEAADSFFITDFITSLDSTGTFEYGDSLQLAVTLNDSSGAIPTWVEVNSGTVLDSALAINIAPLNSAVYLFRATSLRGCTVDTSIAISVNKTRIATAPTGFTPNRDGANDAFFIQTDERVTSIKIFRVYDRWGELVFEGKDLEPNNPQQGWDGTFRGKPLQSSTFAWYAEIEFMDGEIEVSRGEVTLIR